MWCRAATVAWLWAPPSRKKARICATAGGVYELLRAAYELVPGVTELAFTEAVVGLRPATADNAPAIGRRER